MLGVPPLMTAVPPTAQAGGLMTADTVSAPTVVSRVWGIYSEDGRTLALEADSVVSVGYRQGSSISQYPVEQGAFGSYNKVATPFSPRVRVSKGGNVAARAAFLARCEEMAASLDLYRIVTPERVYLNANIERIEYARNAESGVGLISVDIVFVEIRQVNVISYTQAKEPSGAKASQGGNVQAQAATEADLGTASGKTPQ